MNSTRTYSMVGRTKNMEQKRARVRQAVVELAAIQRLADISLADIAERSDVSVRTLLRYYGNRDGLFRAVADEFEQAPPADRPVTPDDVEGALHALGHHYEHHDRLMLMLLAQEDSDPIARLVTDRGKAFHRNWVRELFRLDEQSDAEQIDLLVVCTDLYTWKLLRHDRGLSRTETVARMSLLVSAVVQRCTARNHSQGDMRR